MIAIWFYYLFFCLHLKSKSAFISLNLYLTFAILLPKRKTNVKNSFTTSHFLKMFDSKFFHFDTSRFLLAVTIHRFHEYSFCLHHRSYIIYNSCFLLDPPNGTVIKYHSSITFWKIPFPHWIPWHLCQKSIPTYDQSNSVPLIYSFIFMQMSHCIYYCCIIVNYKFWSVNLSTVFLNKTLTCRSFVSPDIFRINFSIFI